LIGAALGQQEGRNGKTVGAVISSATMSAAEHPTDLILTREQIVAALRALSDELGKQSITGEVCVFGGTVMLLA
jgi:hypothetical protein